MIFFFVVYPFSIFRSDAPASEVMAQLVIVESNVLFHRQGETTYVATVGVIRNDGDISARDIYVEVQYFDPEGALIDAEGGEEYGLTLLPGSEAAFNLRCATAAPESDYASHKVFIRSARDGRSRL